MTVTWTPPPVRLIRWTGDRPTFDAALATNGWRAAYLDGWAVVVMPGGPPAGTKPVVAFARQQEYVDLNTGSVMTQAQVREKYPGAV